MLDYLKPLNPFDARRSHQFYWFDENTDGIVDVDDTYTLYPEDLRSYNEEDYKKRVASDIKSPYTEEFTIGLHQELFKNFSIRINYIHKTKRNIIENVLYDPDSDKDWYTISQDTQGWWIPFETIIPEVDDFPDTQVSAYYRSTNAPVLFYQLKNVPELTRKYQALEIAFEKRMLNNLQLNGFLVISKATGNIGLNYDASSGFSSAADNPNFLLVNLPDDSRLDLAVLSELIDHYDYQLKFIVDNESDQLEIENTLEQLGNVDYEKVMLMPQASSREELVEKSVMVAEICKRTGFAFSQRLQVLLWNNQKAC